VLLLLLALLAVAPVRLSGRADWLLQPGTPPILLRPIGWFVAMNASITVACCNESGAADAIQVGRGGASASRAI
jgi:hypothetical protein